MQCTLTELTVLLHACRRASTNEGAETKPTPAFVPLVDLLHACPIVLRMLPLAAWPSLAASCSGMRNMVRKHVRMVSLPTKHVPLLLQGNGFSWLGLLILTDQTEGAHHVAGLLKPQFDLLACMIMVYAARNKRRTMLTVLLLRPKPDQTDQDAQLAVELLEHLLKPEWSGVTSLCLSYVKPGRITSAVIAQLSKGVWPELTAVDLCGAELGAAEMADVVKAPWPMLTRLLLASNSVNSDAVYQLLKANSPALGILPWVNMTSSGAKLAWQLSEAQEPRKYSASLSTAAFYFAKRRFHDASRLEPKLLLQHLDRCKLGVPALSAFPVAYWPCHEILDLTSNSLDLAAVSSVADAHLPKLKQLSLRDTGLSADGIRLMVDQPPRHWQPLIALDLSYNQPDTKGVQHLVKGRWTSLTVLALMRNQLDPHSVFHLAEGWWPHLNQLALDASVLNEQNAAVIGLDPDDIRRVLDNAQLQPRYLTHIDLSRVWHSSMAQPVHNSGLAIVLIVHCILRLTCK